MDQASWDGTGQNSVTVVCVDFQGFFVRLHFNNTEKTYMIETGKEKGNTDQSLSAQPELVP